MGNYNTPKNIIKKEVLYPEFPIITAISRPLYQWNFGVYHPFFGRPSDLLMPPVFPIILCQYNQKRPITAKPKTFQKCFGFQRAKSVIRVINFQLGKFKIAAPVQESQLRRCVNSVLSPGVDLACFF